MSFSTKGHFQIGNTQMPPLVTQAKSLAQAGVRVVRQIATGQRVTRSAEEQERIKAICDGCEFQNKEVKRCSLCGCFKEWMTFFAAGECKKGKW